MEIIFFPMETSASLPVRLTVLRRSRATLPPSPSQSSMAQSPPGRPPKFRGSPDKIHRAAHQSPCSRARIFSPPAPAPPDIPRCRCQAVSRRAPVASPARWPAPRECPCRNPAPAPPRDIQFPRDRFLPSPEPVRSGQTHSSRVRRFRTPRPARGHRGRSPRSAAPRKIQAPKSS